MSNYIEIQNRKIGADFEPVVIAEIGINHGGSLKIAKEMVDSAIAAGVEIIKHQTHIVDDEMSSEAKKVIPGNADISIYEIMKKNSLNEEEEYELKRYIENKGVIFISTPFSRKAVDRLANMDVSAYKIGSGECNNYPLIEYIASQKKPMIVSTGMNNIKSISKTVDIIKANNTPFALLHTTNLYPTPNNLVRLGSMMELPKYFPNIPYGLSDHTISNHACFGAIALGASIVERHFTDSMDRVGPDIICSMDEYACSELIKGANILFEQRQGSQKVAAKEEKVTIDFAFASVVSIRKINKGEVFSPDNIWVKRPGKDGIPAENYNEIIGKRAKNEIQDNVQIKWKDIK